MFLQKWCRNSFKFLFILAVFSYVLKLQKNSKTLQSALSPNCIVRLESLCSKNLWASSASLRCRIVNTTGTNGQLQRVLVRTDVRKAPPPGNFTVYKNNAYNIYSRQFLQWAIRDSEKAKELLEWSKDTLTPDEHYWRTLETVDEAPDKGVRRDAWQIARYIKWRHPGLRCSGEIRSIFSLK